MKIGIPVYDDVDMFDVTGPFEMFDWANFDVEVVASEPGMKRFRSRGFPPGLLSMPRTCTCV